MALSRRADRALRTSHCLPPAYSRLLESLSRFSVIRSPLSVPEKVVVRSPSILLHLNMNR